MSEQDNKELTFCEQPSLLVVTCSSGVSNFLAEEIEALGFEISRVSELAVETSGTLEDCMRLNLHLRTAHRVLYALDKFRAKTPEDLYRSIYQIPWENYLEPNGYFSIDRSVDTPTIRDTRFASLKVKDAIVDRMRSKYGYRPNCGNERSGACVFLHWVGSDASIYIDTTGDSISRRGYRVETSDAPVRESLAAALIMASGWKGEGTFVNPMCGCGTFAIEAALMACNCPPSFLRDNFAFMHLVCYQPEKWFKLRGEALKQTRKELNCKIIASDIDEEAVEKARCNAVVAGVSEYITFQVCDFAATTIPEKEDDEARGVIIMNPPYGERLGDSPHLLGLYSEMGVFVKENQSAFDGYILSGNSALVDAAGIIADEAITFYNGGIPCEFMRNPEPTKETIAKVRAQRRRYGR